MTLLETLHRVVRRTLLLRGGASEVRTLCGRAVHFYRLAGRGSRPPVVLVHGLGGNANGFARLLFGLADRFSAVYALDLPGNGFSPLPETGPLLLEEHLAVLHAFCREVMGEAALVVGCLADGYVSADNTRALHAHWPGSTLRWLKAGHVSALFLRRRELRRAVADAFGALG